MPDIGKIESLKKILPDKLEEDLKKQKCMIKFEEVKQYVTEQVHARREPYFAAGSGKSQELAHVTTETKSKEESEEGNQGGETTPTGDASRDH